MAGARGRAGKVISSGRMSAPVRPLSCKKRTAVRKISTTSADSGYSLCSTDSEDQVLVLHEGLDRCAALLQDILQSDVREPANKPNRATFPRAHAKSANVKKSLARKPASHVLKEKGFVKRPVSSSNVQRASVSAKSPAVPTTSSDHVQTQMQLLNRVSSQGVGHAGSVSTQGPESTVLFNYRLPTSTPTLSPQHLSCPQDAGYEVRHRSLPLGGAAHFLPSGATTPPVPPAMCHLPVSVQPMTTVPSHPSPPIHQADQMISQKPLDSELLQYIAAHLAQLQRSESSAQTPLPLHPTVSDGERPATDTDETSSEDEETFTQRRATARDISCQTSFNNQKKGSSPEKAERKIKTVKYLLGEIKALVADQDDGEAQRLITELEHSVSLLPAVVGSTNVHAEIALALQPLRSENAQLRRRIRILNQQLRDRERTARSDEHQHELTSLQCLNETLQHQLTESEKTTASLQNKNQELLKVIEDQKAENKNLSQILQEKEQEILQISQQNNASTKLKSEAEDVVGKMKSVQFKLESAEKENQILGITLRQRDAEVSRLRELTRTLQSSMAKLLCDLGKDNKPRGGGPLTQATLDRYEKQLGSDPCAASTSIMSYLKKLEMDQVVQSDPPDSGSANYDALTSVSNDRPAISKSNYMYPVPESVTTSIPQFSPQKPCREESSESCYVIGDFRPDETTYLPLTSSPHKAHFTPSLRNMCTPPKSCSAERDLGNRLSYAKISTSERNPEAPKNVVSAKNPSHQPTKMREADPPPLVDHSRSYPPLQQPLRSLQIPKHPLSSDPSLSDVPSARCDWSMASFSTFTSHDEQDFRNGLAALDANIARLQRTLQSSGKQ